jgi:hypothetical protein
MYHGLSLSYLLTGEKGHLSVSTIVLLVLTETLSSPSLPHFSFPPFLFSSLLFLLPSYMGGSTLPAEQSPAHVDKKKEEEVNQLLNKIRRVESQSRRVPAPSPSVDVVLGSQWGDEGKGKLGKSARKGGGRTNGWARSREGCE